MKPSLSLLFPDSNILRGHRWPDDDPLLLNAFDLARRFGIAIGIAEAVQMELEQHWAETYDKQVAKDTEAIERLRRATMQTEILNKLRFEPATARLSARIAKAAQKEKELGIFRVPLTNRPARFFYAMAARKVTPFREKGIGFKDAVILQSILDYVEERYPGTREIALLTADVDFDERGLSAGDLVNARAVRLFRGPEALISEFQSHLDKAEKAAIAEQQARAREALVRARARLTAFLTEKLKIPASERYIFPSDFKLLGLRIEDFSNVAVTQVRASGSRVEVTAECRVSFRFTSSRVVLPGEDEPIKIGAQYSMTTELLAGMGKRETYEDSMEKSIKIRVRATREGSKYGNIVPVSAWFPSAVWGET